MLIQQRPGIARQIIHIISHGDRRSRYTIVQLKQTTQYAAVGEISDCQQDSRDDNNSQHFHEHSTPANQASDPATFSFNNCRSCARSFRSISTWNHPTQRKLKGLSDKHHKRSRAAPQPAARHPAYPKPGESTEIREFCYQNSNDQIDRPSGKDRPFPANQPAVHRDDFRPP